MFPADKYDNVRKMKAEGRTVAFIGDGITLLVIIWTLFALRPRETEEQKQVSPRMRKPAQFIL